MSKEQIRRRIFLFQSVMVLGFVVLTAQLWRIQILGGESYQTLARENSIRSEVIDAPRGVIYDRQGRILVRNRPSFRAILLPANVVNETWQAWTEAEWEQAAERLTRIADALGIPFPHEGSTEALQEAFHQASGRITLEEVDELCQEGKLMECFAEALIVAPFNEVMIQRSLAQESAFKVMENHINLPGLTIVSSSQREYLYGQLYAHLLGYELPISQSMLDRQTRLTSNPYLPTDRVGMAGLEAGSEDDLRGVKGRRWIEENVLGQRVRSLQEQPSIPGHNLFLTIDTELQKVVMEALQEGMESVGSEEGVAIVMNPNTGEVLAMVSLPTYDNNLFAGPVDPEAHEKLIDDPLKPMFNRAISGTYPPGSIFKIVPAAGALADGVITRDTVINDPGKIILPNELIDDPQLALEYGQTFVCWLDRGHDDETVVDAVAHSCDVFFYQVGGGYPPNEFKGLGIDSLIKWTTAFGLGEPTRISLPGEAPGHVPTRKWKRLTWQQSWVTGDTYNMSIGQGFLTVTPLQILNATTAIANGGVIYEPQAIYQVQDATGHVKQSFEPRVLRHVNVPPEHLALVAEGMLGATTWDDGTANLIFKDSPVRVAGKTGTAEYCEPIVQEDGTPDCKLDAEGNQLTHAWFTAFAPYENPEIALVVFVHGNKETVIQGSEVAAPIARRIIDYYFSARPLEPVQPITPATPEPTATTMPTPPVLAGNYRAIFLETNGRPEELSAVSGHVLDREGNPIPGVRLTIDRGGSPVATVTTEADGSFFFGHLNASQSLAWYVRADLPGAPYIYLNVAPYSHYTVRFQEEP
ncbi:MAG: penicillin-binding protein 2 [Chloroflexota bacterium]|nr:penicillin-binding protein 2 [Chloroflexota bacterium]